jgi:hypothetical protein
MEKSDLIEPVRNKKPLWDQRDKNYHDRMCFLKYSLMFQLSTDSILEMLSETFRTTKTFFCIPLHFYRRAIHAPKLASSHKDRDKHFFRTIKSQ